MMCQASASPQRLAVRTIGKCSPIERRGKDDEAGSGDRVEVSFQTLSQCSPVERRGEDDEAGSGHRVEVVVQEATNDNRQNTDHSHQLTGQFLGKKENSQNENDIG